MTRPTQGIIAFPILRASLADHNFPCLDHVSCPHRLCGFLAIWRWLCRLSPSRTAPKRALSEALSPRSGIHRPCKPSSLAAIIVTTPRGGTAAAGISAATEWNYGFGWIGPFNLNTFGASASRRHHRHGAVVSYPRALNPVYPRLEPPRRLGAAAPSRTPVGVPAVVRPFGAIGRPGLHRLGAGGVPTSPNFRAGAATVSPGFAGGGFHGGLGGGNFHHFHSAGIPHIGAPVSPGFAGAAGSTAALAGRGSHGALPPHILAGLAVSMPAAVFMGLAAARRSAHRRACLAGLCRRRRVSCAWRAGGFHGAPGGPHIGAPASPGLIGGGGHR